MSGNKDYRVYSVNLAANEERRLAVTGAYVQCLAGTGSFAVRLDDGAESILHAGTGFRLAAGGSFDNISLVDKSGAANTIELAIGFGDFVDSRLTVSGDINISKSTGNAGYPVLSVAGGAFIDLKAASPAARRVQVINTSTFGTVFVGGGVGSQLNIPAGYVLGPGQSIVFETAGSLQVYNPGSQAVTLSICEDRD